MRTRKYWGLPDPHFFHNRIVSLTGRDEDYVEIIIANVNELVHPDDVIIFLGDVIFSGASRMKDINERMNGRKWLTKGNHDMKRRDWYMDKGFDFVGNMIVIRDVAISHKPLPFLPPGCRVNYHGHLHNSGHHDGEFDLQDWHKLFEIETTLAPIDITDFK